MKCNYCRVLYEDSDRVCSSCGAPRARWVDTNPRGITVAPLAYASTSTACSIDMYNSYPRLSGEYD